MSKILSVNAGSSSFKFQLLEMPSEAVIAKGIVERIGFEDAIFSIKFEDQKVEKVLPIENHEVAVNLLLEALLELKIVSNYEEIAGVGHRVVHGGEKFDKSVVVTDEVLAAIESLSDLAPLHNPANITGIKAFAKALPHAVSVAVFDTAFHQTMPKSSYLYPTPYEWYTKHGVRKYGFHGTSHLYVSGRAAELLEKPIEDTKIITVHVGNGGSLCAVLGGKSIDTSMGFTPLAGMMMGTRSGDVDPAVIPFMMEKENMTIDQAIDAVNKKSGVLGVSLISSDMRDVEAADLANEPQAQITFDLFVKRICDYIGSYFMTLGGVDAIVFTAGIGENDTNVRQAVVKRLKAYGVTLDAEANNSRGKETVISTPDSSFKVFVIPTNEELVIARDTFEYLA